MQKKSTTSTKNSREEEEKKKKEEEKLKRKQEHEAKAVAKKIEKEKKEAWKVLKWKHVQKPARVQDDSSSEDDSDEVIIDDLSEASSKGDESDFYNEGMVDCCHWDHPQCTDFDYKGKTAKEIKDTPWVSKYC